MSNEGLVDPVDGELVTDAAHWNQLCDRFKALPGQHGAFGVGSMPFAHPGRHLYSKLGAPLYCPLPAEVVAYRLNESNPTKQPGTSNFILLLHKVMHKKEVMEFYSLFYHPLFLKTSVDKIIANSDPIVKAYASFFVKSVNWSKTPPTSEKTPDPESHPEKTKPVVAAPKPSWFECLEKQGPEGEVVVCKPGEIRLMPGDVLGYFCKPGEIREVKSKQVNLKQALSMGPFVHWEIISSKPLPQEWLDHSKILKLEDAFYVAPPDWVQKETPWAIQAKLFWNIDLKGVLSHAPLKDFFSKKKIKESDYQKHIETFCAAHETYRLKLPDTSAWKTDFAGEFVFYDAFWLLGFLEHSKRRMLDSLVWLETTGPHETRRETDGGLVPLRDATIKETNTFVKSFLKSKSDDYDLVLHVFGHASQNEDSALNQKKSHVRAEYLKAIFTQNLDTLVKLTQPFWQKPQYEILRKQWEVMNPSPTSEKPPSTLEAWIEQESKSDPTPAWEKTDKVTLLTISWAKKLWEQWWKTVFQFEPLDVGKHFSASVFSGCGHWNNVANESPSHGIQARVLVGVFSKFPVERPCQVADASACLKELKSKMPKSGVAQCKFYRNWVGKPGTLYQTPLDSAPEEKPSPAKATQKAQTTLSNVKSALNSSPGGLPPMLPYDEIVENLKKHHPGVKGQPPEIQQRYFPLSVPVESHPKYAFFLDGIKCKCSKPEEVAENLRFPESFRFSLKNDVKIKNLHHIIQCKSSKDMDKWNSINLLLNDAKVPHTSEPLFGFSDNEHMIDFCKKNEAFLKAHCPSGGWTTFQSELAKIKDEFAYLRAPSPIRILKALCIEKSLPPGERVFFCFGSAQPHPVLIGKLIRLFEMVDENWSQWVHDPQAQTKPKLVINSGLRCIGHNLIVKMGYAASPTTNHFSRVPSVFGGRRMELDSSESTGANLVSFPIAKDKIFECVSPLGYGTAVDIQPRSKSMAHLKYLFAIAFYQFGARGMEINQNAKYLHLDLTFNNFFTCFKSTYKYNVMSLDERKSLPWNDLKKLADLFENKYHSK